jgi:hypothetical protein
MNPKVHFLGIYVYFLIVAVCVLQYSTDYLNTQPSLPTYVPSNHPSFCQTYLVTCCFTLNVQVIQFYVDQFDLTTQILPQSSLGNRLETKMVIFQEPDYPSVIAIKGYEQNELLTGSLLLKCISTNPNSGWNNLVSESSPEATGWKTVNALSKTEDEFPHCWYCNDYDGQQSQAVTSSSSLTLNDTCGLIVLSNQIRPNQGSPQAKFWTVKKWVNSSTGCLRTRNPTLPTSVPSKSPILSLPTFNPTSTKPTFHNPTASPFFSYPTSSPLNSNPTAAPLSNPPTSIPTSPPTLCFPRTITCCFSCQTTLVQLYVNEVDLTSEIYPQSALSTPFITKNITFIEPTGIVTFAMKGYESSELTKGNFQLKCSSTNPFSAWNFESIDIQGIYGWKYVTPLETQTDSFPANWFVTNFTQFARATTITDDSYNISCMEGEKIRTQPPVSRHFWAVRKIVNASVC